MDSGHQANWGPLSSLHYAHVGPIINEIMIFSITPLDDLSRSIARLKLESLGNHSAVVKKKKRVKEGIE